MYRYQHHFGLLYRNPPRNPTILRGDGFDVASTEMGQPLSTEHGRIVFIEIQRQGIIPSPMCLW